LVLISPLYCRVVSGKPRAKDNTDNMLHACHIYQRMFAEYKDQLMLRRFVPVIMPGAKASDVPAWLCKLSQPFQWPTQACDLMFYLIKPAQVIADYVSRRDRHY